MGVIRELPVHVVNKIAAGEVVERPASIVKELVENSIDAGATKISVLVDEGGIKAILISDNGSGIEREDLSNAFLRHATSKISSYEDLFQIISMGFRGEALAAIASVSKVHLTTKTGTDLMGSSYQSVPGTPPVIGDWDGPKGTTIRITDLFDNVPVRRKFLKTPATELSHVQSTLVQIALGHPEIAFSLTTSGGRTLLSLPSRESPVNRLVDLYPDFDLNDFAEISIEGGASSIRSYILTPSKIRKDRQNQHLFLNRRWVRHPAFYQAVTSGGQGLIQKDVHLGVWIYLNVDPKKVDVNVHPTKKDVRFQEPDRIFALVMRTVSEGIARFSHHGEPASVDLPILAQHRAPGMAQSENSQEGAMTAPMSSEKGFREKDSPGFLGSYAAESAERREETGSAHLSPPRLDRGYPDKGRERELPSYLKATGGNFSGLSDKLRSLPKPGVIPPASFDFSGDADPPVHFLAQVYETFLVASIGGILVLVDQHTAGERIRYDALRTIFTGGNILSQPFLFPSVVRISTTMIGNLESRMDELLALGFKVEPIGPESLRVDALPAILAGEDPQLLIEELSSSSNGFEWPLLRSDRVDETLMTLSCHTSIRAHERIEGPDAERLILSLLKTDHPFSCPHGRPTILSLEKGILESWFNRS